MIMLPVILLLMIIVANIHLHITEKKDFVNKSEEKSNNNSIEILTKSVTMKTKQSNITA